MKRILSLALAVLLAASACTGGPNEAVKTPQELTQSYADAILNARDDEFNQYYPLMTEVEDEEDELVLALLGIAPEDVTAFAIAISLRNVTAYTVAALMPASGREEAVQTALEGYLETQKKNFEFYLEDQYEVARAARLESLRDGTLLLVMAQDSDRLFDDIKTALNG